MGLLRQLEKVEIAAKVAKQRVDKSLLKRKRGQSNPALPNFIFRCGQIWKSLTERKPSAEKVHRKIQPKRARFPNFRPTLSEIRRTYSALAAPSCDQFANTPPPRLGSNFFQSRGCDVGKKQHHASATVRECPDQSGGFIMHAHKFIQRKMLNAPEAASYCGSSASTLAKFRLYGGGPSFSSSAIASFTIRADLDAWLAAHRQNIAPERSEHLKARAAETTA